MDWIIAKATDIGGRPEQQDRVSVLQPRKGRDRLVVLADGMGGQREGASAAQTVVDIAKSRLATGPVSGPKRFLEEVCFHAHRQILGAGRRREAGPGSTCALLYLRKQEAYWVHVGDSRLYHFCDGELMFRTRDHSIAELIAGDGPVPDSADPAAGAPVGLYMCLGGKNELSPEFGATAVTGRDWFMLCSDGFWGQVSPAEVSRATTPGRPLEDSAKGLVELAKQRAGAGGDNISLVLVRRRSSARSLGRLGRLFGRPPAAG